MASNKLKHIVTGPLASGKSTFVKNFAKDKNLTWEHEYQDGVDVTKDNWWDRIQKKSNIIETHFEYEGLDLCDCCSKKIFPTKMICPPKEITIHYILPSVDLIYSRSLQRDKYSDIKDCQFEYDFYHSFYFLSKEISILHC